MSAAIVEAAAPRPCPACSGPRILVASAARVAGHIREIRIVWCPTCAVVAERTAAAIVGVAPLTCSSVTRRGRDDGSTYRQWCVLDPGHPGLHSNGLNGAVRHTWGDQLPLLPITPSVHRAAISAAEALHLYATTITADAERHGDDTSLAVAVVLDAQRLEEARGACQVLGASLDEADDKRRARDAWCIAGHLSLDAEPSLDDLAGYEELCRTIAREHEGSEVACG